MSIENEGVPAVARPVTLAEARMEVEAALRYGGYSAADSASRIDQLLLAHKREMAGQVRKVANESRVLVRRMEWEEAADFIEEAK